MQILIMPGGEFGPDTQHLATERILRLAALRPDGWAVQAVMPAARPPSWFLDFSEDGCERINRIAWLTSRRWDLIKSVTGAEPRFVVTDHELQPLQDFDFNARTAAVARVARSLTPAPLSHYGLGVARYSMAECARTISGCGFTAMAFSTYAKSHRDNRPADVSLELAMCRLSGIEPLPYIKSTNEKGEPVERSAMEDLLGRLEDGGATRAVAWCTLLDDSCVDDVGRVLELRSTPAEASR